MVVHPDIPVEHMQGAARHLPGVLPVGRVVVAVRDPLQADQLVPAVDLPRRSSRASQSFNASAFGSVVVST